MRKPHPKYWAEDDGSTIGLDVGTVLECIADWYLHPTIVGHYPERRERGAKRDHRGREQVEPWPDSGTAEHDDTEKACLESEGGECLVGDENALNIPRPARQLAPVGTEFERHYDPGHHAETEDHAKDLQPELEHLAIGRTSGREIQSFEDSEPRCHTDRERREDDVERDGEREL